MRRRNHTRRHVYLISLFLLVSTIIWNFSVLDVKAGDDVDADDYLEIRLQGTSKKADEGTKNAVPQGMAGNGNTVYLIKNRETDPSYTGPMVPDRTYIIKVTNANTSSAKVIFPENAIYAGHANGMTYYNGYLYIAAGDKKEVAIYRAKEAESSVTNWNPDLLKTVWLEDISNYKDKTLRYQVDKITVNDYNSGEEIRNIAHYTGNYFIVCLEKSWSNGTNTMKFGVGPISGSTFTIQTRFTVTISNTYEDVQDIDYKDGYLWIVLYKNEGTDNHIHLVEIPTSFSNIEDGKTYEKQKTVRISEDEAGHTGTRNELEAIYVNGSNYYTWSNIRDTDASWSETFCRYTRFPNGVPITSVTTQSKQALVIKWNTVSNANEYRIDRRIAGGEYATIKTVSGSTTSYTDTGLTAGTKYYYRVYGKNSGGDSPKMGGVAGVTRTETPKVTAVTALSESELKVTWTAVTGAQKYIVCRKKEGDGEGWEYYRRIKEVTGTEYIDTGLEPETKYHYGIVAVTETGVESGNPNENGNPSSTNRLSGTTLAAIQVTLNQSALNLTSGEPYQLTATVTPAYAANSHVHWSSSDSSVAVTDQTGKVTALNPGTAVITATEEMKNKTARCTVTVNEPDLVLPLDLTEIEEYAFKETDAETVLIHNQCTRIGAYAFSNSSVRKIWIPSDCVLEEGVFDGCDQVTIYGTAGSSAQIYCEQNENCEFVEKK